MVNGWPTFCFSLFSRSFCIIFLLSFYSLSNSSSSSILLYYQAWCKKQTWMVMARWIMPSSRPSLIKHTMPWAKAGRGARLLKGIDEGLVNGEKTFLKTFHISSTACWVMLSVTVACSSCCMLFVTLCFKIDVVQHQKEMSIFGFLL